MPLEQKGRSRIPFTALCFELVENLEDFGLIESGPIFNSLLYNALGRSAHQWGVVFQQSIGLMEQRVQGSPLCEQYQLSGMGSYKEINGSAYREI